MFWIQKAFYFSVLGLMIYGLIRDIRATNREWDEHYKYQWDRLRGAPWQ